jgi:NAD(P)-dependent dehydrogenase (short-subunit alcohol dehydrogenase family)
MAQVWLVTGSSRGLGRAIVEAGLLAGNKVLATARDIESLRELSERYGDQVKLFELDVTDESSAAGAVKTAIDAFGSLDVVINNAGYGNLSSVEDTPMWDFRAQIETNLFGTIIVTKAALPYFRERNAGHFVQFSSTSVEDLLRWDENFYSAKIGGADKSARCRPLASSTVAKLTARVSRCVLWTYCLMATCSNAATVSMAAGSSDLSG